MTRGKTTALKSKSNVQAFTIYESSNPVEKVWDFLTTNHIAAIISPIHDKDVWTEEGVKQWRKSQSMLHNVLIPEDAKTWRKPTGEKRRDEYGAMVDVFEELPVPQVGESKTPHRHVMVLWDYSMPVSTALEKLAPMKLYYLEGINSRRQYLRYMCHLDNPEKARYDVADVMTLGGLDISPLYEKTQPDRNALERAIIETIKVKGFRSLSSLQDYFVKEGQWLAYCEVKAKFGYWVGYMKSCISWQDLGAQEYTPFDTTDLTTGEVLESDEDVASGEDAI